jgi:hypothetical protein
MDVACYESEMLNPGLVSKWPRTAAVRVSP